MPTLMRNHNAERLVNYLNDCGFEFELSSSNYTTKITSEIVTQTFVLNMQSLRTFAAFARLKKDLSDKQVPNIQPEQVRYFEHDFKKDAFHDEVMNIDLKSAYARVFLIDKMIQKETFDYFSTCRKQERLASIGMLASRKKIFKFKDGKPISYVEQISPLSGFFFYCVKRTQEIMAELKNICGQKYLFTWVDGIYFLKDEQIAKQCEEYLNSIDFLFSKEVLNKFRVVVMKDNCHIYFYKDEKLKTFCLPSMQSEFKKVIMESIILLNKQNKDEKSKAENSSESN